jgi:hypothetical protein
VIVADVSVAGAIDQLIAVQAPEPVLVLVDLHVPVNALIGVVGVVGADVVRSHAASATTSSSAADGVNSCIGTSR